MSKKIFTLNNCIKFKLALGLDNQNVLSPTTELKVREMQYEERNLMRRDMNKRAVECLSVCSICERKRMYEIILKLLIEENTCCCLMDINYNVE
jgi:hypothetical protein